MNRYIALLRAINVGGYRKIKMAELRQMFHAMGFQNVSTYIQSGNIVFDAADESPSEISERITLQIEDTFGHEVPTLIRSHREMKDAFDCFPFQEGDGWKGYISFLMHEPDEEKAREVVNNPSEIEKFELAGRELHVLVNKKADQKPLFSNSYIEKLLDCIATSRNLRTVSKILDLARA